MHYEAGRERRNFASLSSSLTSSSGSTAFHVPTTEPAQLVAKPAQPATATPRARRRRRRGGCRGTLVRRKQARRKQRRGKSGLSSLRGPARGSALTDKLRASPVVVLVAAARRQSPEIIITWRWATPALVMSRRVPSRVSKTQKMVGD
jgi:hypothetical protein